MAGLVDHIVEAGHRVAALGRGQAPPPGDESPTWSCPTRQVSCAELPRTRRRHGTTTPGCHRIFTMPWGAKYTGATLVDMYLAELAAHAWDLAWATGRIDELDPSVPVTAFERGARAMIKPEYRDMVEPGSPFGRGGAAAPGRRRLGTPRRLHGTRPASTVGPVEVRRVGVPPIDCPRRSELTSRAHPKGLLALSYIPTPPMTGRTYRMTATATIERFHALTADPDAIHASHRARRGGDYRGSTER